MQRNLFSLSEWQRAKKVFVYVSIPPEPSTNEIMEYAFKTGKQLAVPKVYKKGIMRAHIIENTCCLVPGVLSIPEPPQSAPIMEMPDIVILPCLACDRSGNRIGHGGGYYDRYLSKGRFLSVCLCPEHLLFDAVPHDANDIKPSIIVTENSIIYPQGDKK